MTREPCRPTISTQADLEQVWRELMGPGGFGAASVWVLVIGADDRPVPQLIEISGVDEPPTATELPQLASFLSEHLEYVGDAGSRVAFLRTRPGSPTLTDRDRAWACALFETARRLGRACEPVHLGTPGEVRPIPPDELVAGIGA
jgi:hypothetical protein